MSSTDNAVYNRPAAGILPHPNYDNVFDATIKLPFGLVIYGIPMVGKSTFIKNLIDHRHRVFADNLDYIVYFYGQKSRTVHELEQREEYHSFVETVENLPDDISDYIKQDGKGLFIFDDLMEEIVHSKAIVELVTKKCQHQNASWIITFQNAFHRGSERLSITRSAQYITIFDSPLDKSVPLILANRIMPDDRKAFLDIFREATSVPYQYLFCDGRQGTPTDARLRGNLFDKYQIAYIATKKKN